MSLFTNLLNLHSASKPREDFFTEIVAYFLSLNNDILIGWLKHHSIISDDNYSSIKISTQQEHKGLENHTEDSRLDIEVELSNGFSTDVIFIESKIGANDGNNSLKKYAEILSNLPNIRHRILIYITRDYDPKKEIKTPAFNLEPKVSFYQLRWHQFYARLQQYATDILAQEILMFMRRNGMSTTNQFSSLDLLTMVNFNKTLNLMESTLSEEVQHEFRLAFGGVIRGAASRTQWKWDERYIIYTHFSPSTWDLWCGLGYFGLNPSNLTDYPYLGIFLQVSSRFGQRPKIIESMQKIIYDKPNLWTPSNLKVLPAWSGIFYRKSLQDFLSEENHVSAIKLFFQESIKELKTVQEQYFDFPWKGVSIETVTETDKEDLDTLPSSIA
ncbi:PD-(D/E)XK nuclease family protein [Nostoc sp. 'Lobaria pulmonaria (5183) cyanobiont']|uniref:PD-(D/E)XK nuclease family protein n=1 Tax=Nostoc sp. 'Lobaria pulmonaria (5183) cyanobiont' TaxID=1618022 RepID=UPI000CF316BF|nr:PD-(D/E)XK nuclease family protein [Nostoc sp. 'Lobaria pulmonaria (5183) cyanobiont']AVH73560.1 PD-(D/E)XK nuclease superfamily protein [Nostoc sp. 'Lobaria pulmonaria (5183) cyanobiont']